MHPVDRSRFEAFIIDPIAAEILARYINDNLRRLNVRHEDPLLRLKDVMQELDLEDFNAHSARHTQFVREAMKVGYKLSEAVEIATVVDWADRDGIKNLIALRDEISEMATQSREDKAISFGPGQSEAAEAFIQAVNCVSVTPVTASKDEKGWTQVIRNELK